MNYELIEEKYKELIDIAKSYMNSINDYEHNMSHVVDVVNYTKELLDNINEDIDKEVSIISAYWHDVGRMKDPLNHEKISADMLKHEMIKRNYDETFIDKCYKAIVNHKWNMSPETIEGLLIKDADKLAWLGVNRWNECLKHNQKLDSIISLLPSLRDKILYFDYSRTIYDRDIVKLLKLLYENTYK